MIIDSQTEQFIWFVGLSLAAVVVFGLFLGGINEIAGVGEDKLTERQNAKNAKRQAEIEYWKHRKSKM